MRSILVLALVACAGPRAELSPELERAFEDADPDGRAAVLVYDAEVSDLLREHGLSPRKEPRRVPIALVDLTADEALLLVEAGARLFVDAPIATSGGPVPSVPKVDLTRRARDAGWVRGVTVALIDSGVSVDRLDLRDDALVAWADFVDGDASLALADPFGHGTTVAGLLVEAYTDADGVPPNLAVARVLDEEGYGTVSAAIAALDWIVAEGDADLVHLSVAPAPLGSLVDDPLAIAVETALDAGMIVIAAASDLESSDGLAAGDAGAEPASGERGRSPQERHDEPFAPAASHP